MRLHRLTAAVLALAGAALVGGLRAWGEPPEAGAAAAGAPSPTPGASPAAAPRAPAPATPATATRPRPAVAASGDAVEATGADARDLIVPLEAREVIDRLKAMRAQLLLDEEYNRLLEARVKRQELEAQLGLALEQPKKHEAAAPASAPAVPLRRPVIAAPAQVPVKESELTVKSVTVAPFKEAFVVYKGRTYTVRPGDKLGDITIRDVTENGVLTNGSSVMLER